MHVASGKGALFSAANIFLKFIHIKKLNYDGVGFLFLFSIMVVKITKLILELRFGFPIGEFVIQMLKEVTDTRFF